MDTEPALCRPLDEALVGGVWAGLAAYLGVRTLAVRAATFAVAAFSGIGFLVYPLAPVPAESTGTTILVLLAWVGGASVLGAWRARAAGA